MDYRNLGRTGIRVSPLTLGCMMFGGKTNLEDSCAIIQKAVDSGINLIDTANVYSTGESEKVTGEGIKRTGLRDHLVLATKCHGNMFKDESRNPNQWGNSRRQIISECERSLKRLNTDYIDLYQIHRPHPDCPIDETLRALDDLVTSGKVRYIGTSTFAAWQFVESLWASKELGLNRFVTEQPPYNILDRRIERELVPMAQTHGVGLIPWSPLAGGFLTGKYKRSGNDNVEGRFTTGGHGRASQLLTDQCFDVIEGIEKIAKDKGCTPSQFALAWAIHQPGITSPIIGPRTMEQLEDNLGALEVEVTDADREAVDELVPPGEFVAPFFKANWGPHAWPWNG